MNKIQAGLLYGVAKAVFGGDLMAHAKDEIAAANGLVGADGRPADGAVKRTAVLGALKNVAADLGLAFGTSMLSLLIELMFNWLKSKSE